VKMNTSLKNLLESKQFPRSNEYDPQWIISNQMGLNPLWLTGRVGTGRTSQPFGCRVSPSLSPNRT